MTSATKLNRKEHLSSRWLGYTLSLLALLFLLASPEISFYFFLYAAGFIYTQPFLKDTWNWVRNLLVAPLFSSAALILLCAVFDLINIPIGIWCMYIVWGGALIVVVRFPFSVTVQEIRNYKGYWFEIAIAVIFLVGLTARVLPVIHEPAPILHDPAAHAVMAKDIIKSGKVQTFYSPGLHFNIAMATLTTRADLARNTLMITQFFNALVAVTSGIFLLEFFKRKWWAILASALFSVGSLPAGLYTVAGKNSLVFNLAFLFLVWAVVWVDMKRSSKIILTNLLLLVSILSHYPSAFICCLGLGVMFLLSDDKKRFLAFMGFAILVGGVWGTYKISYQLEKISSLEFRSANKISVSSIMTRENIEKELKTTAVDLRNTLLPSGNYDKVFWQIGMLVMVLLGMRDRKYWFLPLFWVITYSMIFVGSFFRYVNPLWIVTSTQMITTFLITYIAISLPMTIVLFDAWKQQETRYQWVIALVLVAVFMSGSIALARQYDEYQTNFHVIEKDDLRAFSWMNNNLAPTDKILVDARIYKSDMISVVFAADSGLWITTYTDFETSAPFERFFDIDTHYHTNIYLKFAADQNNCALRNEVLENGFTYFFKGSRPVHTDPNAKKLDLSDGTFELQYKSGVVEVYKILPCSN